MAGKKAESPFNIHSIFTLIFLTLVLLVACILVWYANEVFLLAFAAILLALLLSSIGNFTKKIIRLPYPFALSIAILFILGVFALIFWLYSPVISDQFQKLTIQLPKALEQLEKMVFKNFKIPFSTTDLKSLFTSSTLISQISKIFSFTVGTIAGFIIFIFVGLYVAYNPSLYLFGFLYVIPPDNRGQVKLILSKIGYSLRWWLFGKIISMTIIGILTFIGLWLMNVSLPFILGLLAGTLTFIPFIGAVLSAIPAVLIALTESPLLALYTILLFTGIHVVEGYLVSPYIDKKTVYLPPAFTIIMEVLFTILFGALGLALAAPLSVVALVLVGQLYAKTMRKIKHTLDEEGA